MLFDTHCHLQFAGYDKDRDEIIKRSLEQGMLINNVGTQKDSSQQALDLATKYPGQMFAVVGLHPGHTVKHHVDQDEGNFTEVESEFEIAFYEQLAVQPEVVGIGECGLDYYRFDPEENIAEAKLTQARAFEAQIELAKKFDKALVIHCRSSKGTADAYEDTLEILGRAAPGRFEVHSFTGDPATAKKFLDLGAYIGVNGIITFDRTGVLEAVVKDCPLDRIVLETDAPYLAPVPFRGKTNEPLYLDYVAQKVADIKAVSKDQVSGATTENAKRLFNV